MSAPVEKIDITILGSGTCVPSLQRSASAVLMVTGNKTILFDIGPGTMRRLTEAGISIHEIDCLLVSHFHPDHTGELAAFLFASRYPDRRQKPLLLAGGPGFESFFGRLNDTYSGWIHLPEICRVLEMEPGAGKLPEIAFDECRIHCTGVSHRPESLAFRVDTPGGVSAVYSGDTDYSENLLRLAAGADLLICEAAFPDEIKVEGHMTPSLAGWTAAGAGVGSLVLTHFYPECENADMTGQCRKTWDGPLVLAVDLLKINARKDNRS